ncbi:MAG: outer membrane protein assembly factor BamE [bacterium]|nr:outer membrane protein assembly factor BamE [bacterium]
MKVLPGAGVGEIRFGQTEQEVEAILGKPDKAIRESHDGEGSIAWHYKEQKLSVYFDEDVEYRLVMLDVDNAALEIDGFRPIGEDEDTVLELLNGLGDVVLEEELADVERRVFDLVDTGLWFWFHKGLCDSVQASVLLDEDDEYVWPD